MVEILDELKRLREDPNRESFFGKEPFNDEPFITVEYRNGQFWVTYHTASISELAKHLAAEGWLPTGS